MADKKKNSGLMVAVFCVILIVLAMFFIVRREKIIGNLKETQFFERVGIETPQFVKNHKIAESDEDEIDVLSTGKPVVPSVNLNSSSNVASNETSKVEKTKSSSSVITEKTEEIKAGEDKTAETKLSQTTAPKIEEEKKVITTRNVNLCFVSIASDGSVNRKIVTRPLPKSDSPLTDSIRALLAGPQLTSGEKDCVTLIPEGTRLIGASVKDGVATLNFSENFEFNSYGVEGCIAQLMQIVYTATEFSTVKSVQFLIEGEKKDYLGIEGQWIGSPLSRASF